MSSSKSVSKPLAIAAVLVAAAAVAVRCAPREPKGARREAAKSDVSVAAQKTYVAPGDLDEYYMFSSGGHSGQVFIYGLPSMRHLATIPVFAPYPATGYGFDDETKEMLGKLTWGDVHHPALSETKGDYDGRWLFVNEMNGRIARIDLRDFKTRQIIGPVPNVSGNHGSAFVTPNTEYAMMSSRFSIPIPKGTAVSIDKYASEYKGIVAGIKIDPESGKMSLGWQVALPPFDWDLGDAGKLVSDGWMFLTCYNSERGTGKLEVTASQRDRDYIAAINWREAEKAAAEGKGDLIGGVKVLDPRKVPGLVYLMPCGKSPHGVDVSPDGKYIIGSGKLQGVTTAFNFEKVLTAIKNKDFTGEEDGIPVLKYESIKDAEVPVGLGPLHTQFGPDGWAYTSLFVDSALAKWKLGTWEVVDKVPMSYSTGHLSAAEGDTVSPDGKWLVGLNKLSHGRHLSVGPSQPESSQLVDISEDKMKLVYDAFTEPEPHYAQIIKADKVKPIEVYKKEENKNPLAVWDVKDTGASRKGNEVVVKMTAVRSTFTPQLIEVNQGDTVKVAVTNIEQTTDELHGFGLLDYNINLVVDPGETKVVTFKADKPGVFPYYCTNFCSALHQEMQGYLVVRPARAAAPAEGDEGGGARAGREETRRGPR
ncbi:Sec-dependent nitrous-oxide reductase [Anaeromyxobacter sp. Fw109-5]|uniref:Sec-dependent nitrous-oxide reductase n=1 Tax=Anaeromyxobacter sp. (strain Fw109-5) TaxID=404589 RepID=UPI0000ED770F|nr:Sec-dependent nitrous-oxide reductase [Anaeromyxobacter sp. Fw109-5]ABS24462.1 Nitrous-oxide reductase [Anaeromyxobacter sp. Fw109-5]